MFCVNLMGIEIYMTFSSSIKSYISRLAHFSSISVSFLSNNKILQVISMEIVDLFYFFKTFSWNKNWKFFQILMDSSTRTLPFIPWYLSLYYHSLNLYLKLYMQTKICVWTEIWEMSFHTRNEMKLYN